MKNYLIFAYFMTLFGALNSSGFLKCRICQESIIEESCNEYHQMETHTCQGSCKKTTFFENGKTIISRDCDIDRKTDGCKISQTQERTEIQNCYCNSDYCNSPDGEMDTNSKMMMNMKSESSFLLKPKWIFTLINFNLCILRIFN